ncbi:platelet-derived growth factor subunit B [Nematolebias whitei]|uniref:platelet-derived growth factor subunit B n=1 Tax=Nematolebias whitei TaxID=451745 RepID=UPI00189C5589|nr:platelet-derived growth factor subunit B [Nematolebias whitei]
MCRGCCRCAASKLDPPNYGDALPAALVELVRNSPISSIEDLQLLLLSDSVDEEDGTAAAMEGHRLPRSLDAQLAQQALCKVRTEVVEVTRAMLDRSNAHFLLWPPCVEVQRCSGCCNTKSLQCVPIITHTRYLQVMKIEYVNKRPTYAKAVVSVVDHVECRCQGAAWPPAPKKKSSRRQHSHLHRNQTLSQDPAQGQVKMLLRMLSVTAYLTKQCSISCNKMTALRMMSVFLLRSERTSRGTISNCHTAASSPKGP